MLSVLNNLARPARQLMARALPKASSVKAAGIYTALGIAIKGVGSAFRSFVDFGDAPWAVQRESLQREGSLLGVIGAATFVSQLGLEPFFDSLKNKNGRLGTLMSRFSKTESLRKTLASKTGRHAARSLMLIPVYIGAELFSRHVGKIDFKSLFNPNNNLNNNPLAYSSDSFASPHERHASASIPAVSHTFSRHYGTSFAKVAPYQLSFSRNSSAFRI